MKSHRIHSVDARGNQGWTVPPSGPHISEAILW